MRPDTSENSGGASPRDHATTCPIDHGPVSPLSPLSSLTPEEGRRLSAFLFKHNSNLAAAAADLNCCPTELWFFLSQPRIAAYRAGMEAHIATTARNNDLNQLRQLAAATDDLKERRRTFALLVSMHNRSAVPTRAPRPKADPPRDDPPPAPPGPDSSHATGARATVSRATEGRPRIGAAPTSPAQRRGSALSTTLATPPQDTTETAQSAVPDDQPAPKPNSTARTSTAATNPADSTANSPALATTTTTTNPTDALAPTNASVLSVPSDLLDPSDPSEPAASSKPAPTQPKEAAPAPILLTRADFGQPNLDDMPPEVRRVVRPHHRDPRAPPPYQSLRTRNYITRSE